MQQQQLRELECSSYYAVIRALYACGRLETFDADILLMDLQEALAISLPEHLVYLERVKNDVEASQLAHFGKGGPVLEAARSVQVPRVAAQPPPLIVPQQYNDSPFQHTPLATSKSKKKAPATGPSGGISKQGSFKKSKSGANTPSTPRSQQGKGSMARPKPLVGAAAAAVAASQQKALAQATTQVAQAQADLERLNARERQIFEALINMGVTESDPDLNDVHRALIKWYRLDNRQKQIEHELSTMVS